MIIIKNIIIGLIGFILTTIGFFYFIVYSNLFTFGYSIKEYLIFMFTNIKNYTLILGIILLLIAFRKGKKV